MKTETEQMLNEKVHAARKFLWSENGKLLLAKVDEIEQRAMLRVVILEYLDRMGKSSTPREGLVIDV